jgi:hypothetical protein
MKMWSGRFRQPLNPEFERWQRSFPFDCRLLGQELAASRAHALALKAAGVLSAEELKAIENGIPESAEGAKKIKSTHCIDSSSSSASNPRLDYEHEHENENVAEVKTANYCSIVTGLQGAVAA